MLIINNFIYFVVILYRDLRDKIIIPIFFYFNFACSLLFTWNRLPDFINNPIIANEILIRVMEVPICNEREDVHGRRRRRRREEEGKKEKMAEKSRRWEGSDGKDKRQHIHTYIYTQHIAERNEYYRLVGLCTDRVSISLFLRLFPSSLSLHLSESSVSRTGTVAGLSGTRLDQLSSSLSLFFFV